MPIRWRLAEVLTEKHRPTVATLAAQTGISRQTLYKLAREPVVTRIDAVTLATLCRTLKVEPGALLEHLPD